MALSSKVRDARVVFTPSGKRGYFPLGTPVLQAAQILGVDIDSVCGGRGICGRCQIVQATGNFPKHKIRKRLTLNVQKNPSSRTVDSVAPPKF